MNIKQLTTCALTALFITVGATHSFAGGPPEKNYFNDIKVCFKGIKICDTFSVMLEDGSVIEIKYGVFKNKADKQKFLKNLLTLFRKGKINEPSSAGQKEVIKLIVSLMESGERNFYDSFGNSREVQIHPRKVDAFDQIDITPEQKELLLSRGRTLKMFDLKKVPYSNVYKRKMPTLLLNPQYEFVIDWYCGHDSVHGGGAIECSHNIKILSEDNFLKFVKYLKKALDESPSFMNLKVEEAKKKADDSNDFLFNHNIKEKKEHIADIEKHLKEQLLKRNPLPNNFSEQLKEIEALADEARLEADKWYEDHTAKPETIVTIDTKPLLNYFTSSNPQGWFEFDDFEDIPYDVMKDKFNSFKHCTCSLHNQYGGPDSPSCHFSFSLRYVPNNVRIGHSLLEYLPNLTYIDLRWDKAMRNASFTFLNLNNVSDFKYCKFLTIVILDGLEFIHIENLLKALFPSKEKLKKLSAKDCSNLFNYYTIYGPTSDIRTASLTSTTSKDLNFEGIQMTEQIMETNHDYHPKLEDMINSLLKPLEEFKTLTDLNLENTDITQEYIKCLKSLKTKNNNLIRLNLAGNKNLKDVNDLLDFFPNIRFLNLKGTSIQDLKSVYEKLPLLKILILPNSNLSDEDIKKLFGEEKEDEQVILGKKVMNEAIEEMMLEEAILIEKMDKEKKEKEFSKEVKIEKNESNFDNKEVKIEKNENNEKPN